MEIFRAQIKNVDLIAPLFDAYRQFYNAPSNIEASRQFIFERLMKHAEQFAYDTGSRGLFLRAATDNYEAQGLYEKCGWVRDEKFYRYDRILR